MRSPQALKLPRYTTLEPSFFARLWEKYKRPIKDLGTISKELASENPQSNGKVTGEITRK